MEDLWTCPTCEQYVDPDDIPPHNRAWHHHQAHRKQSMRTTEQQDPAYRDRHQPHQPTSLPTGSINSWMSHKDRSTRTLNTQGRTAQTDDPTVSCQTCGQIYHCQCAGVQLTDVHNYICPRCLPANTPTVKKTYLHSEANEPSFMSKPQFTALCNLINKIERKGPTTLNHRFNFRQPTVTWELLAGSSAHSYACNQAQFPPPSVVVERTKACDPVLRANCGPTLHHIFRYIQAGHPHSMPLPSHYAYYHLRMRGRTSKEQGRKRSKRPEAYTLDLLVACLICTPYSRMGLQNGFNQGAGRAFCEVLRILADTPTNVGMTEQCTEFTTADNGKVFSLLLHCLTCLHYEVAWRVHNTSHGGMPQDRKRVYIIYIKKPGPSPSFLMDLDLSPSEAFRREQTRLNARREFPFPERLVQFPLHQTKYTMPVRTDGKTGAILTGPRRTTFAAQHHQSDDGTQLTTLSGPIHISNLLSLQELPQNHLAAAPSLNAQYSDIGNSCSGEIALQQLRRISTEVDRAMQQGKREYTPTLSEYCTINATHTGDLASCLKLYCSSPGKYRGACTNLAGQWMLIPKGSHTTEPLCTLLETITKSPIGTRRQLNPTNITYLTPKEAAHVLFRSMDSLSPHQWLLDHLFLAAGQAYQDRVDQPEQEPTNRNHEEPEEFEDIDEWVEILTSALRQP